MELWCKANTHDEKLKVQQTKVPAFFSEEMYKSAEAKKWRDIYLKVESRQMEIAEAYKSKRSKKVKKLVKELVDDFDTRRLAVKLTLNGKGGRTPGPNRRVYSEDKID